MEYLINSGLPASPVGVDDKSAALVQPLYSAVGVLTQQLAVQTGQVRYSFSELLNLDPFDGVRNGNSSKVAVLAGEPLIYGDLLCLTPSGSNLVALKADNTVPTKFAMALCDAPGGLATGARTQVMFMQGRTRGIAGTILGGTYYLGTAGGVTGVIPGGGATIQIVGTGLGTAGFYLNILPRGVQ